ncbi:MAG: potassium-transporting ATPase subunit KdpC [Acidobacteriaceae bacterium]
MSRFQSFSGALRFTLVAWLLVGLAYPLLEVAVNQALFPNQANGSLIRVHGRVVGSRLIGQNFQGNRWFHGRPSAVKYNPMTSGGSNLGPTSHRLERHLLARANALREQHRSLRGTALPSDMVTSSGSGLDPDISPENAYFQASWVARARGIPAEVLDQLIARHIHPPLLGLFGDPYVNVLDLNLVLRHLSVLTGHGNRGGGRDK